MVTMHLPSSFEMNIFIYLFTPPFLFSLLFLLYLSVFFLFSASFLPQCFFISFFFSFFFTFIFLYSFSTILLLSFFLVFHLLSLFTSFSSFSYYLLLLITLLFCPSPSCRVHLYHFFSSSSSSSSAFFFSLLYSSSYYHILCFPLIFFILPLPFIHLPFYLLLSLLFSSFLLPFYHFVNLVPPFPFSAFSSSSHSLVDYKTNLNLATPDCNWIYSEFIFSFLLIQLCLFFHFL